MAAGQPFTIDDFTPTQGDILKALQEQRSRVLSRTQRGVDANESPFAPYNKTRPYYVYPSGPVGKKRSPDQLRRERASVKRFAGKVGRGSENVSRSGLGLKFPSYDAFKRDFLGRSTVDLFGARAPHMLQAITIRGEAPNSASIGIYGDEGVRAAGISGASGRPKGMPRRDFWGPSHKDEQAIAQSLADSINRRLR